VAVDYPRLFAVLGAARKSSPARSAQYRQDGQSPRGLVAVQRLRAFDRPRHLQSIGLRLIASLAQLPMQRFDSTRPSSRKPDNRAVGTTPVKAPSTAERLILRATNVVITFVVGGVFFMCAYTIAVNLWTYSYGETTTGVVTAARHPSPGRQKNGVGVRFAATYSGTPAAPRKSPDARANGGSALPTEFP
jgi:hypothetical protein